MTHRAHGIPVGITWDSDAPEGLPVDPGRNLCIRHERFRNDLAGHVRHVDRESRNLLGLLTAGLETAREFL